MNNSSGTLLKLELWELLVPTRFEDTQKPVRTRHHKKFDEFVLNIAGGITVLKPSTTGKWIFEQRLYEDRVIPVRIACTRPQIDKILYFAKLHYRQMAVMAYKLSDEVIIR